MTVSSQTLVELVLLGPLNDRRQLQDSPILGDVWIAFAATPPAPLDLLIPPDRGQPAGPVAVRLAECLPQLGQPRGPNQEAHVAYLQGLVAARLFFREVVALIVPMTQWWRDREVHEGIRAYKPDELRAKIQLIIDWARTD